MSDHSIEVKWLFKLSDVEYWLSFRQSRRESWRRRLIITKVLACHFHLNQRSLRSLFGLKLHSIGLKSWRNYYIRRLRSSTHRHHCEPWRCLNSCLHHILVMHPIPSKCTFGWQFQRPWSYVISTHWHLQTFFLVNSLDCRFELSLKFKGIRFLNVLPP